ncbi:TIR domain-containing protein [Chitinophaga sp. YR627]|uniref:toll/interleukin-1 receptor domain-containing protein n=1 Tax=Chitinophaga sp. YR627 TaxID=1881041 RepID=UPI0008E3BDF9|nr:TIR domain-containing protein [Chitinophaga sp. YR627]SFM63703.1 TIR domain-containing protein [Chitinophaga sp. YR627]
MEFHYDYDVTLSFAGENRDFVSCVAKKLHAANVKVFYDEYEQVSLWGKDLYTHLDDIYKTKAKYCVMFISKDYKEKLWTNHERKSAQERAFKENEEYILPFRLDATEIPGIRATTGYLSREKYDCQQLADAIMKKLGMQLPSNPPANDRSVLEPGIFLHKDGRNEIAINMSDFFAQRLSSAFPGVRGLKWFDDSQKISQRLKILLRPPLIFEIHPKNRPNVQGKYSPIWWFRGGKSMPIDRIEDLSNGRLLIGKYEYDVDKIAVYVGSSDNESFIYVKVRGESSVFTGITGHNNKSESFLTSGFTREEYAIYKNQIITREEFDDGAAEIEGTVINFTESPELRVRCLSPFNFIISAQTSIYNSQISDSSFKVFLDKDLVENNEYHLESFINNFLNENFGIESMAPDFFED